MTKNQDSVSQIDQETPLAGPPGPFIDMSDPKNQAAIITLRRFLYWFAQNTADETDAMLANELYRRLP